MGQFLEVFTRRGVSLISIVTSSDRLRSILLMGWIGIFYDWEGVSTRDSSICLRTFWLSSSPMTLVAPARRE